MTHTRYAFVKAAAKHKLVAWGLQVCPYVRLGIPPERRAVDASRRSFGRVDIGVLAPVPLLQAKRTINS